MLKKRRPYKTRYIKKGFNGYFLPVKPHKFT